MKIDNKIIVIILMMLTLCMNLYAFEKVGTTSFQFLEVYPGARASAMSDAFCTIVSNSESVFWNPAGLARVKNFDVTTNYVGWLMDIKHYALSAAYNLGDAGVIGFQGIITDVGAIEETRTEDMGPTNPVDGMYNPGLTGRVFNPNSMVIGLSYALQLTDKFSFGVTAKYVKEDLIYAKASTVAFDGGFLYDTKYRSVVIGASIRHFGPEVKFIDKSYPLPQTFNIGISANLFAPDNPLISSIGDQKLLMSYNIIQPRDYSQRNSVGLEYSFQDMVFIRGGYTFNNDQEGISAGFGVKLDNYRIDYSYNNYGEYLNSVHRITIGYELE